MQPFANHHSKKKMFLCTFDSSSHIVCVSLAFWISSWLRSCLGVACSAYCYDNSMMYVTFWDDGFGPGLVIVSVSYGALWDTLSSGRDATSG